MWAFRRYTKDFKNQLIALQKLPQMGEIFKLFKDFSTAVERTLFSDQFISR